MYRSGKTSSAKCTEGPAPPTSGNSYFTLSVSFPAGIAQKEVPWHGRGGAQATSACSGLRFPALRFPPVIPPWRPNSTDPSAAAWLWLSFARSEVDDHLRPLHWITGQLLLLHTPQALGTGCLRQGTVQATPSLIDRSPYAALRVSRSSSPVCIMVDIRSTVPQVRPAAPVVFVTPDFWAAT